MKVCPWLLFLALLAGLGTGCSTGPAPRPTTVQVLPGHHLGFVPPAGWKAEGDHAWVRSHEGRLSVQVFGPDPRQEAVDQLTRALDLLARDSAAATGSLVRFPPRSFEYDPDREALVALCTRVRQATFRMGHDPLRARRELQAAREGFLARRLGDDPQVRARHFYGGLALRGGQRELRSVAPTMTPAGPGALAVSRDPFGALHTGLFVVLRGHLVVFEIQSAPDQEASSVARLQELAAGFVVDASPSPAALPSTLAGNGRPAAPGAWRKLARQALPAVLFLVFTALPAWLGAGLGYATARATGSDPRPASAMTAFQATGCGIFLACFLAMAVMVGLVLEGPSGGGGGIMSPGMGLFFLGFLLLVVGTLAGLAGGALAAVGAWLGAG